MTIYRVLLLAGIIQGAFLTLSFLLKTIEVRKTKKPVNPWLLLLLSTITLSLLVRYAYSATFYARFPHLSFASDTMAFFFGPMWYFFIYQKVYPEQKKPQRVDGWYLFPLWFQLLFIGYLCVHSPAEVVQMSNTYLFGQTFYIFCALVVFSNAFYFFKAHRLLPQYPKNHLSSFLVIRAFHWVMWVILGTWAIGFLLSFLKLVGSGWITQIYLLAFVTMALFVFLLAFWSMHRPAVFADLHLIRQIRQQQTDQFYGICEKITQVLTQEKLYTQPELSLIKLAEKLQVPPRNISQAINQHLQLSFTELINQYRIQHFLELVQLPKNQHLTHWALAQEAGFKNKATFYNAFKKETQSTPKTYLKTLA